MAIPCKPRRLRCGERSLRLARKKERHGQLVLVFHAGLVYLGAMSEIILRYRGRSVTHVDLDFIRQLLAAHPQASRRQLSALLCQAWNWVQPNGQLRDMICRSLMLQLHRQGLIELPAQRLVPPNNVIERRQRRLGGALPLAMVPVEKSLSALGALEIRQVRRTAAEPLFGRLMQDHHYLGYSQPVGEHLKYLAYAQGQPVAALAWSASSPHVRHRDQFVGWTREECQRNIHLLAYNTRFLVLPWVRVPHLASHLLGRLAHRIATDWQQLYGHPIYLLETFVDPERFRGTCYRAANWTYLGLTTGRGKNSRSHQATRSRKEHWVYPLTKDFRRKLRLGHDEG
jgi:hypothetical protein